MVRCYSETATPEIYTLSLHDALPISQHRPAGEPARAAARRPRGGNGFISSLGFAGRSRRAHPLLELARAQDRKSTRLNSSHVRISYAVFCLTKKKKIAATRSMATSEW